MVSNIDVVKVLDKALSRIRSEYICRDTKLGFVDGNSIAIDLRKVVDVYRDYCYRETLKILTRYLYPYKTIPVVKNRSIEWIVLELRNIYGIITSNDIVTKSIARYIINRALFKNYPIDRTLIEYLRNSIIRIETVSKNKAKIVLKPSREAIDILRKLGYKEIKEENGYLTLYIDRKVVDWYLSEEIDINSNI